MAGTLNKTMLIGHLGADPESRSFQNGGKVVNLRLATSETWRDKSTGERKENTQWHSVAIFAEHAADFAEKYLRKGHKVYVEGQLETRKWQDQSGNDRYSTEVVLRPFSGTLTSLERAEQSAEGRGYSSERQGQSRGGGRQGEGFNNGGQDSSRNDFGGGTRQGGFGGGGFQDDLDDDVPF